MKITIDSNLVEKSNLSLEEVLMSLIIKNKVNPNDVYNGMVKKGYITDDIFGGAPLINIKVSMTVDDITRNSQKHIPSDDAIKRLYDNVKELFPRGHKPDTAKSWRGSLNEFKVRIKLFYERLDLGDEEYPIKKI